MNTAHKHHHEDGNLPAARRHLDNAVSALIDPKPHTLRRDNGTTEITWIDSLYDQLTDAVAGQTGARSGGRSSVPVWVDVVELLDAITATARDWYGDPTADTIACLVAVQSRNWRPQDTALMHKIADKLTGFADKIGELLNPEPVIYLMAPDKPEAAACTACSVQHVWKKDPGDNNRPKRQPALKVTAAGCHCQNCGATWEPGALRVLAAALGYPLPVGVLE